MRKTVLLAFSLPLLLTGCQTWGPTWSELSGQRYSTGAIHQYRRPAVIEHVDDQGSFVAYPVKMTPGSHRLVLSAPAPGWPGGSDLKVLTLDAAPCKRYYVNAQFANNLGREWTPVIDYVEVIAGCTIVAKN